MEQSIPSGRTALDAALGCGGYPRGRLVEIYGPESSGKTTLALHFAAQAIGQGGSALFIDADHALDSGYVRSFCLDPDRLLLARPDNGDRAVNIAASMLSTFSVDAVIIDSSAALEPEIEEPIDAIGSENGLLTRATRKLAWLAARAQACVLFVSQVRQRMEPGLGDPVYSTGGRALKHHAAIRISLTRAGARDRVFAGVVKNKVSGLLSSVELDTTARAEAGPEAICGGPWSETSSTYGRAR